MLFPIQRLLEGRDPPLCIRQDQTVREALTLMIEHDYSQLPVVDRQGRLLGLISQESVAQRHFHLGGQATLLDLTVDHCQTKAVTLPMDRDIFEALDRLKDVYAVVITREGKPEGILTEFDMAHFFRDLTGDLLVVEDIETSLRQIVQKTLPDDDEMNHCLIHAFGEDSDNPGQPMAEFDELSFSRLTQLITHPKNWTHFEPFFKPMEIFRELMDQVRQNRNQLAHFRGRLDKVQHEALIFASQWLADRPIRLRYDRAPVGREHVRPPLEADRASGEDKYAPLRSWLEAQRAQGSTRLSAGFSEIEELLGEDLPESARNHRSWWANEFATHFQARAWLAAGWLVDDVDFSAEEVSFRQSRSALYPPTFDDMLSRLKSQRPGFTRAKKTSLDNWLALGAGRSGYQFIWSLPREPVLRVELNIDAGDKVRNKEAFDVLEKQKEAIERQIGEPLNWEWLEGRRASRISATKDYDVTDPNADHEDVKRWGVETMLRFIDAFQPRLRDLP